MSLSGLNTNNSNVIIPQTIDIDTVNTTTVAEISAEKPVVSSLENSDSLKLSSTTNTYSAQSTEPLPTEAGGWKRFTNAMGSMFSNIADGLRFGETYNLISEEHNRGDKDRDGRLNTYEFNVSTLNLLDFWGTEFSRADKNRDNSVDRSEYVDYRKEQLGDAFNFKDKNGDRHVSVNEIGWIGKQFLEKKDPRLDENQDGLVNKREFTRSVIRGSLSIKDLLGI